MYREQIVSINNVRIWTALQGKGRPIVLCHGGPGLYDYLKPVADMVDELCEVLRYDQRGSGRSQVQGPYTVVTFIDDLESLRQHFNFEQWIVAGHSWGAGLALAYAAKFPAHTKALIYISGTGIGSEYHTEYWNNWLATLRAEERETLQRLYKRKLCPGGKGFEQLRKKLHEFSRKADVYDVAKIHDLPSFQEYPTNDQANRLLMSDWETYTEDPQFRQAVYDLQMPALFLHGAADPRSAKFIEHVAERLVHGEFHVIQRASHYPWIEQPEEFKAVLKAFIKKQS